MSELRRFKKGVPMITVPDVAEALDWYLSIGFKEMQLRRRRRRQLRHGLVWKAPS